MLPAFNGTFTCWIFSFVNYLFTCFPCLFSDLRVDAFLDPLEMFTLRYFFCKYVFPDAIISLYRIYGLLSIFYFVTVSLLYLEIQHTLQFLINDQYNSISFHFMFARFYSFIYIGSLFIYNFPFIFSVRYMFILLSIWWVIPIFIYCLPLPSLLFPVLKIWNDFIFKYIFSSFSEVYLHIIHVSYMKYITIIIKIIEIFSLPQFSPYFMLSLFPHLPFTSSLSANPRQLPATID